MSSTADRPSPSAGAIGLACTIIGLVTGYFIGQAQSIGIFGTAKKQLQEQLHHKKEEDEASDNDEWIQDIQDSRQALREFPGNAEECKLVLVVRTDLGMGKGKIAAQCCHATLACYKKFKELAPFSPVMRRWEKLGQAKVALQCSGEEEMEELWGKATSLGLCAEIIHDAGRTQIAAGSATVLGIGPAPKSKIDEVTGHLKLL